MLESEVGVVGFAHDRPSIVLDVRKGEERLDGEASVTVLQIALYLGDAAIGSLDCLVFRADRVVDSDSQRHMCAGRLWDLHEIVSQAFGERGVTENCFADGAFAVLEHIEVAPDHRRQRIGERALRSDAEYAGGSVALCERRRDGGRGGDRTVAQCHLPGT